MPPRRKRNIVIVDEEEPCGSAQSRESIAKDKAAQPALLAAASKRKEKVVTSRPALGTPTATRERGNSSAADALLPAKKTAKKKKRSLDKIAGFDKLADSSGAATAGGAAKTAKKEKPITALTKAAKHMQGPKKGQLSGRVFYALNCAFEDNKALKKLIETEMHASPRWFSDWGKWAICCPTADLALKLHYAVLAAPSMKATARKLNKTLDVTTYADPAIKTPHFVVAESETQFETNEDGVLPRSVMLIGEKTYDFKEFMKAHFEEIKYRDLVFNDGAVTKSAWILPVSAQTDETGTLADFLRELGATVEEVDLDDGEDESDDGDADDEGFIDREAEEVDEPEEEGQESDDE